MLRKNGFEGIIEGQKHRFDAVHREFRKRKDGLKDDEHCAEKDNRSPNFMSYNLVNLIGYGLGFGLWFQANLLNNRLQAVETLEGFRNLQT